MRCVVSLPPPLGAEHTRKHTYLYIYTPIYIWLTAPPPWQLEDEIAKFFNVPESITYSDLNSTVSSTIPAFVKRGDLLIIDEHANDAVFTGAQLSRARVRTFRHNDMVDLERVLTAVDDEDRKYRRVSTEQRRFIIVRACPPAP